MFGMLASMFGGAGGGAGGSTYGGPQGGDSVSIDTPLTVGGGSMSQGGSSGLILAAVAGLVFVLLILRRR